MTYGRLILTIIKASGSLASKYLNWFCELCVTVTATTPTDTDARPNLATLQCHMLFHFIHILSFVVSGRIVQLASSLDPNFCIIKHRHARAFNKRGTKIFAIFLKISENMNLIFSVCLTIFCPFFSQKTESWVFL